MTKQEVINNHKSKHAEGSFSAELLIFVFVNGNMVFSKNFSHQESAEALGWEMLKSSNWYGFGKVETLRYEVINFVTGEMTKEFDRVVLYQDLSKRKEK